MPSVEPPFDLNQSLLSDLTLLRERQVRSLLKLSHSTLYALVKAGRFSPPIRLGERARAWRAADLREWLKKQEGK